MGRVHSRFAAIAELPNYSCAHGILDEVQAGATWDVTLGNRVRDCDAAQIHSHGSSRLEKRRDNRFRLHLRVDEPAVSRPTRLPQQTAGYYEASRRRTTYSLAAPWKARSRSLTSRSYRLMLSECRQDLAARDPRSQVAEWAGALMSKKSLTLQAYKQAEL